MAIFVGSPLPGHTGVAGEKRIYPVKITVTMYAIMSLTISNGKLLLDETERGNWGRQAKVLYIVILLLFNSPCAVMSNIGSQTSQSASGTLDLHIESTMQVKWLEEKVTPYKCTVMSISQWQTTLNWSLKCSLQ